MVKFVLPTRSFHQLFLIRLLLMVVMAAFLAHWKVVLQNWSTNYLYVPTPKEAWSFQTLLYTKKTDDRLISIVGGVNGVMNCLSRYEFRMTYVTFGYILKLRLTIELCQKVWLISIIHLPSQALGRGLT